MNDQGMNTNQTGTGNPFASQQSPQSNPFTGDLQGEFTSGFGTSTNTNTVSQIFKDGQYAAENKRKILIGIGVGVLIIGLFYAFVLPMLTEESDPMATQPEMPQMQQATPSTPQATPPADTLGGTTTPDTAVVGNTTTDPNAAVVDPAQQAAEAGGTMGAATEASEASQGEQAAYDDAASFAGGGPTLISPVDGDSRPYDETAGPAIFRWEGSGRVIKFSRSRSMRPLYMSVPVRGASSYAFYNPYPGTWYWQVDGGEVRSFTIEPPVKRNIQITSPTAGGSLAGTGGVVQWTEDSKIAFYRVEFSADGNWGKPAYRFATSPSLPQIQTQGIQPGQYQVRVGAFSEVAGRWEYTDPITVTVQ